MLSVEQLLPVDNVDQIDVQHANTRTSSRTHARTLTRGRQDERVSLKYDTSSWSSKYWALSRTHAQVSKYIVGTQRSYHWLSES